MDYSLLKEAPTQEAVLLNCDETEISIEPNENLFSLGFGRSSEGHGVPRVPGKHLLEIDEYLYLKAMNYISSDYSPQSETYELYELFRRMNYIPKPGFQFGCQFILYRQRVDRVHSEFLVITIKSEIFNGLEIARRMKKTLLFVDDRLQPFIIEKNL